MDPKAFFEDLLPKAIARQPEPFLSTHGALAIAIPGKGAWTIFFGNPDNPIVEGFLARAQLKVRFVPSAFSAFTEGKLDVPSALQKRHLQVSGDPDLLDKLSTILAGGGSAIGARMAFSGRGRF